MDKKIIIPDEKTKKEIVEKISVEDSINARACNCTSCASCRCTPCK